MPADLDDLDATALTEFADVAFSSLDDSTYHPGSGPVRYP